MKRRRFLVTSGSGLISASGISALSQNPSVALDFSLSGVPTADPSNVESLIISFDRFNLTPRYIDDGEKATVTVSLKLDSSIVAENSAQVKLTNGEATSLNDITEAVPIAKHNIGLTGDIIVGEVIIQVDHPSISDTFRQNFSITSSDIAVQSIVGEEDLIAWWPLNESGGKAIDYSGNNRDADVFGATQSVGGRKGITAYSFNSSNGDGLQSPSFNISNSDPLTISALIRPSQVNNTRTILRQWKTGGSPNVIILRIISGKPTFDIWDESGTGHRVQGSSLSVDQWYRITATYDGSTQRIFINGSEEDDFSFSGRNKGSLEVEIGRRDDGSEFFDGVISDVRIYDTALPEKKVRRMYEKDIGDFTDSSLHDGSDAGSVARYEFNGGVNDSWNNNNGNATNVSFVDNSINNKSASFSGNSEVSISATERLNNISRKFTVSLWVRPSGTSNGKYIEMRDTNSQTRVFSIGQRNGNFRFVSGDRFAQTGKNIRIKKNLQPNVWNHICAVGGSNIADYVLYINGEEVGSKDIDMSPTSDEVVTVGYRRKDDGSKATFYDGLLDDIRIYDRAFSESKVQQLYLYKRGKNLDSYLESINT